MSWSVPTSAASDRYERLNAYSIASNAPLLAATWIKIDAAGTSNRGGLSISTSTTDARANNILNLRIASNERCQIAWTTASNNGPTDVISDDTWALIGVYIPTGFTGATQSVKFWFNSSTSTSSLALTDYSGDTFKSICLGDGTSVDPTGCKGSDAGIWSGVNGTQADTIMGELLTLQPSAVSITPTVAMSFRTGVDSGFSANGSVITIDSGDNPSLSAGSSPTARPIIVLV